MCFKMNLQFPFDSLTFHFACMELFIFIFILQNNIFFGFCGTLMYYPAEILNWDDARAFCQSEGMDLAIIEDNAEMTRVEQCILSTGGFAGDVWIGARYDTIDDVIRRLDNTLISNSDTDWDSTEPNYMSSGQHCIRIMSTLKMRTMYCSYTYTVLCEADDPLNNCIDPSMTTTTTTTLAPPPGESTKKSGLSTGAIIGLVVGFISFIVLVSCCVCIWKTFCGITDEDKIAPDPDGLHDVTMSEGATKQLAADNPWLKHEEISFCLRNKYTFQMEDDIGHTRSRYIK